MCVLVTIHCLCACPFLERAVERLKRARILIPKLATILKPIVSKSSREVGWVAGYVPCCAALHEQL